MIRGEGTGQHDRCRRSRTHEARGMKCIIGLTEITHAAPASESIDPWSIPPMSILKDDSFTDVGDASKVNLRVRIGYTVRPGEG